jgi:KDO2-lipid IV(A) lauroyltransferase
MRILPEAAGREVCVWIGRGGHLLVGRDRRLARANLARVYPGWSRSEVKHFARVVFEEIGRNAFDFLRYPSLSGPRRDDLVRIEGLQSLDRAIAEGKGVVVVTAHLGCWEILAASLARRGYPLKAMARPLREPRLDAELRRHRSLMGVETISSQTRPVAATRHLKAGGLLGVLADQRIKEGGEVVEFLGQTTRMTDAPARLARATDAAIVAVGIRRLEDDSHLLSVLPPLDTGDAPVTEVTRKIADSLGNMIREAPEQWIWIHPRWEDVSPTLEATKSPGQESRSEKETVCA